MQLRFSLLCGLFVAMPVTCMAGAEPQEAEGNIPGSFNPEVRIQLQEGQERLVCKTGDTIMLENAAGSAPLPPGEWAVVPHQTTPARQRYHVFTKTFPYSEKPKASAYAAEWSQKGYNPEIMVRGRQFETVDGQTLENRRLWISLARFDDRDQAEALRKALEGEEVYGWIHPERLLEGGGTAVVQRPGGAERHEVKLPFRLASSAALTWDEEGESRQYTGTFVIEAGPDGELQLYVELPLETYLAEVTPAEMPALWPIEAVRAQAICARSYAVAHLGLAHSLEGFDFCDTQDCKVFKGETYRHPQSTEAVESTRGTVITQGPRIVPGMFSSNAGGWTEANDTVWSSPPDAALRAVPELPKGSATTPKTVSEYGVRRWLSTRPEAFSANDERFYRWRRTYSNAELARHVNQRYAVGRIRAIEPGDRGAGGRLQWVRVIGSEGSAIIRKELPIRLAFGGLPSAMFIVDTTGNGGYPDQFQFIGGGRGHGVGLSQYGARGMAEDGYTCEQILQHYFTDTATQRIQARESGSNQE